MNLVLVLDRLFVHRPRKLEAEFTELAADFLAAVIRVDPDTD